MTKPRWDVFFEETVRALFISGARILDIGAGLRVDAVRGNVVDPKNEWIKPLLEKLDYKVMDLVDTYHPDIVGDVMAIPLPDNQFDVITCLAVLEHVSRPWDAAKEMYRVLKPGGSLLLYVPFLFPFHAMPGYYTDYFRYTDEGIRSLLGQFINIKIEPVRGPVETLVHFLPKWFGENVVHAAARWLDSRRASSGKQTAGYYAVARKPV